MIDPKYKAQVDLLLQTNKQRPAIFNEF